MQCKRLLIGGLIFLTAFFPFFLSAQVNTVDYGKNRVQYKKFKWKFYQTSNFNTYTNQGGLELGKFVAQIAEEELKSVEQATEYSLQRRASIVVYNTYDDYKTSNIGLGMDWQNAGGLTKLVNNKLVLYYNGDHQNLRLQVRQGLARILVDNILFGDDIGEVASNAALLDLPKWLTDGYVSYIAEPWSTTWDDQLKSAMLSGTYNKFYSFAFKQPELAGHAFWYYIAEKYKKENVTYFLYLARLYKNLNTASLRICKKKFKNVLDDFMQYEADKYYKDIRGRRNAPKGKLSVVEETTKSDFFRFNGNPNPRNNSYAVVEFTKGIYQVKYVDNFYDEHVLLKYGVKTRQGDINPNYPILAWDGKGSRLLVIYWKDDKINLFVYDVIAGIKRFKQQVDAFDQILDAGFMLDAGTLLLSAVKNGHSDIYTYKIETGRVKQITNDVYDDLNPTVVAFPNRVGIIFSSNRPGPNAPNSDTALPSRNHFNVFLIDINNNSELKQISQLTNVKFGDAKYPMQYNTNHFTYVNDENGIANRWAGFFTTQRNGLDTLWYVGDQILRNPGGKELDSTLAAWQKQRPDSVSYFQVYKDSTYTFPITNYQSSLLETRIAGNNGQVSEIRREGDYKFLYKLKPDSIALRRRNVNPRPTDYIKQLLIQERLAKGASTIGLPSDSAQQNVAPADQFQNEFETEKKDSTITSLNEPASVIPKKRGVLANAGLFNYGLKFSADYVLAGFTNNVIINRYQPYAGGAGPIKLNNGQDLSWMFRVGVSDVMEDVKLIGGFRFGTSIRDKDAFLSLQNYRKRLDWGLTYYRSNVNDYQGFYQPGASDTTGFDKSLLSNNLVTNLYQANLSFPFDEVRSLRLTAGVRTDKGIIKPFPYPGALPLKDSVAKTLITRLEYVYDNTISPVQNIWDGLRWKVYSDFWVPLGKSSLKGKHILNVGADARYYVPIYRNFIWAGRVAADFSLGDAKVIYYMGGVDGWTFNPKFSSYPRPNPTVPYAFQTLAVNMRGYKQNLANGNNDLIINSEFRLPVFTTFFDKPINNAFIRNFQLIQFIDLGTAWDGTIKNIKRPSESYYDASTPVSVQFKAGGIGPLAGGYGFGARSTLLGYFIKYDVAWPMKGIFRGSPVSYVALGLDF